MARKRHTAEEIVAKLRQVDVLTSQGRPVAEAVRSIGVTEVTYYRWRQEYGGLKGDQVKRLKELEAENTRRPVIFLGSYTGVALHLTVRMRSFRLGSPFNHENPLGGILKLTASARCADACQPVR